MVRSIENKQILVTGASGYVGGRLIRVLARSDYPVRCMARKPEYVKAKVPPGVDVVAGDVLDKDSLKGALQGVDIAYYLVHSMGEAGDFEEKERLAAQNFSDVAKTCGVGRIIYLGGLGKTDAHLSSHLRSRQEVGKILRRSGVQTIEFRASIVLGSGSLSFEMIRALTEKLPVMTTPRWVSVPAQPIAIGDLLQYLCKAAVHAVEGNPVYEIGGRDVVTYGDLMREYAQQRGLKRLLIRVPVLTPRLSGYWLGLVTPVYARIGRRLVNSLRHPTVVTDDSASRIFGIDPVGVGEAIALALRNEDQEYMETRWTDALASGGTHRNWGGVRFGSRIVESRTKRVMAEPAAAFAPIMRVGGDRGWYFANFLWRTRGLIDLLVGGVGMRRGRRDPERLRVGDVVDFWRVEALEPGRRLLLIAEMKLPGRAWLEFDVRPEDGRTVIRQTAIFDPKGLFGLAYWYALYPLHKLVFSGMLQGIAEAGSKEGEKYR